MRSIFALLGAISLVGCAKPSHIGDGQIFRTGTARYDAYFARVHELQVSETGWNNERKDARRPLVDELKLQPNASDWAIVHVTRDRMGKVSRQLGATRLRVDHDNDVRVATSTGNHGGGSTAAFIVALESTTHNEVVRMRKLKEVPTNVGELVVAGRQLKAHVDADFAGTARAPEVRDEIAASFDVLTDLARASWREERAADVFVTRLVRVCSNGDGAKLRESLEVGPAEPALSQPPEAPAPATSAAPAPPPAPAPTPTPAAAPPSAQPAPPPAAPEAASPPPEPAAATPAPAPGDTKPKPKSKPHRPRKKPKKKGTTQQPVDLDDDVFSP